MTEQDILEYGFDHVVVATGSSWRRDGVGRWHTHPIEIAPTPEVLTPDDIIAGRRPAGKRVVLFDDDHYYLGAVIAELLAKEGYAVTLVTPAPQVSQWTVNTMEAHRIRARIIEPAWRSAPTPRSPRSVPAASAPPADSPGAPENSTPTPSSSSPPDSPTTSCTRPCTHVPTSGLPQRALGTRHRRRVGTLDDRRRGVGGPSVRRGTRCREVR